jgi:hypothetical protein
MPNRGVHPAAMNGLVEYFAGDIKNKKVIIGINLLWMSSRRHDLSGEQNMRLTKNFAATISGKNTCISAHHRRKIIISY